MKTKKIAFVLLHFAVFLFVFVHLFVYVKKAVGVIGVLQVGTSSSSTTGGSFNFVGPTPGASNEGALPTSTPQYYVVVAYDGNSTALVKSAPTACNLGSGKNQCNLIWPCVAGASTYRAFYGSSVNAVLDAAPNTKYLNVSAPTTSVLHQTVGQGGLTATVPSGNLPMSNMSPRGGQNVNTLACKFGLGIVPGTPTPAAQLQVVGHVNLDTASNVSNLASPSAALDIATKAYADYRCSLKRKKL